MDSKKGAYITSNELMYKIKTVTNLENKLMATGVKRGWINWETEINIYTLLLLLSRSVVSNSVRPHGLQPTRLLHPWDFPDKSTGVGCHYVSGRGTGMKGFQRQRKIMFGAPGGNSRHRNGGMTGIQVGLFTSVTSHSFPSLTLLTICS